MLVLRSSPDLAFPEQLELRANPCLDPSGASRLAPLLHPHYRAQLRCLDLGGCPLGDAGFAELVLNIAQNKQLQVGGWAVGVACEVLGCGLSGAAGVWGAAARQRAQHSAAGGLVGGRWCGAVCYLLAVGGW